MSSILNLQKVFYSDIKQRKLIIVLWLFQTEISAMLESLRKKLRMLNNTKEHWEETKNYIQVKMYTFIVNHYML